MKVWITKYALTRGIEEITSDDVSRMLIEKNGDLVMHRKSGMFPARYNTDNYSLDKESAIKKAEEMRKKKIESLKKQIDKLERIRFE